MNIEQIYHKLLEMYGPQGWWPVTPIGGCKGELPDGPIYGVGIKNQKQKLEIVFGAILTQNTGWKNVMKAIVELNKKDLIDIHNILKIPHEELAQTIKSSGYFNQKAKKLKNVCEFLKKYPLKTLDKTELWKARKLLLSVNGIGPETADSILLYVLDKPIFVVDAYTKRIFSNLGLISSKDDYDKIQKLFIENLKPDAQMFNEYHALIVEHAKRYYQKKSTWQDCPLLELK